MEQFIALYVGLSLLKVVAIVVAIMIGIAIFRLITSEAGVIFIYVVIAMAVLLNDHKSTLVSAAVWPTYIYCQLQDDRTATAPAPGSLCEWVANSY